MGVKLANESLLKASNTTTNLSTYHHFKYHKTSIEIDRSFKTELNNNHKIQFTETVCDMFYKDIKLHVAMQNKSLGLFLFSQKHQIVT